MDRQGLAALTGTRCPVEGSFIFWSGQVSNHHFDKYLFETDSELLRKVVARRYPPTPMFSPASSSGVCLWRLRSRQSPTGPPSSPRVARSPVAGCLWSRTSSVGGAEHDLGGPLRLCRTSQDRYERSAESQHCGRARVRAKFRIVSLSYCLFKVSLTICPPVRDRYETIPACLPPVTGRRLPSAIRRQPRSYPGLPAAALDPGELPRYGRGR